MIPGVGEQACGSIFGYTERAVLEITDDYVSASEEEKPLSNDVPSGNKECENGPCAACLKKKIRNKQPCMPQNVTDLAETKLSELSGQKDLKSTAVSIAEEKLSELPEQTGIKTPKDSVGETNPSKLAAGRKRRYLVQFNPSELSLRSEGNEFVKKGSVTRMEDGKEVMTDYGLLDVKVTLTVPLIFNQVNVQDSFMWEKFRLDPANVLSGTAKAFVNGALGAEYTVQTEVEGFLAAIMSRNQRNIAFYWGDMCYEGILSGVNSEYTMFSVSGKPVSAKVTLEIVCGNKGLDDGSMGVWEEYYDKVFARADSLNLEQGIQNAGNLVSLGL